MRKHEIKKLKIYIAIACFVVITLVCFFSYLHYKKYHYINKGKLVAKINGFEIYKNDIQSRVDFLSSEIGKTDATIKDLDPEAVKAVLMEIYTNDLILKLAKKKKLFENNKYKFLAKEYYHRLIKETYINDYVLNNITEDEIKQEYDRLIKIVENKEERKIRHILVSTEEEINRIRNTVIRKNNFEKIAEQKSIDKPSAINGGSIGYVIKEEITVPEFANVAFLLKAGEISKPIKTKEGWHLIRVDDIRKIKMKSFEESRTEILEKLRKKKFEEFINSLLKNKNNEINLEIIDNNSFDVDFENKYSNENIKNENK